MPGYDRVLVEIAGGIGTVTLNRPEKLNAFDGAQCRELHEALRMLAGSEAVRVIVITGAGRAFCAGAALALGLFDRVVPHGELGTEARRVAELWAAQPVAAVRRAKEALYASEASSLAAMLDLEIAQQQELFATAEARQRIGAALS